MSTNKEKITEKRKGKKKRSKEGAPQLQQTQNCKTRVQSRRPSSSSSSSSSSNNFKRRAYCSSRFFFCHNLRRKNDNIPTIINNINIIKIVEPVPFLELELAPALLSLLESSEMPETKGGRITNSNHCAADNII